jgi:hypothetical protein
MDFITPQSAWTRFSADMSASPQAAGELAGLADEWLMKPPPSVVYKKHPAPSGDPHDYVSFGAYYWPDPATPDGLPWINRDGEVNPIFYEYDSVALETLCPAINHLVTHAVFTGSAEHARGAGRYLRTWFIDPSTRMNPHLRYAQFVPGLADGRPIGIIDTTSLVFLLDVAQRLPFNEDWMEQDLQALKKWFSQYVDWLLTSDFGKIESQAKNNHGTWYDAQVCAFLWFTGRLEEARPILEGSARARLAAQIEPDGRQPHELARTLSLTYCTYNLLAFICLARVGEQLGIDLWRGRLRAALGWMYPYYHGRVWEHPQIKAFDLSAVALVLNLAGEREQLPRLSPQAWKHVTFSKAAMAARSYEGKK